MVRRNVFRWALAASALLGARSARADPIQFTGNVENDFSLAQGSGVTRVVASPLPDGSPDPHHVPQAQWITDQGWTTGWSMKDVRLKYDKASDTMAVGVNFFGIAGDADGNGNPGVADPRTQAVNGLDTASLGGRKSISLGLDFHGSGTPDIVAGVPADKSTAGPGLDGFNIATYHDNVQGLAYGYGKTLTGNLGGLAFDPSKDHPGFEFTIKNFSTLPGYDPNKGFDISAFAGSPDDVIAGEDAFAGRHVKVPAEQNVIPEPSTILAWTAVAGLAALRARRRRVVVA